MHTALRYGLSWVPWADTPCIVHANTEIRAAHPDDPTYGLNPRNKLKWQIHMTGICGAHIVCV